MVTRTIEPNAEIIRLYEDHEQVAECRFVSEVIGSEGHWYNYLFISNRNLTQGAINDIKIRARQLGANSIHIHTNIYFTTSVTLLGQAYDCE